MNVAMNIKLDMEKLNVVMSALSKLPWEAVHPVIADIDAQVKAQLNQASSAPPEPEKVL